MVSELGLSSRRRTALSPSTDGTMEMRTSTGRPPTTMVVRPIPRPPPLAEVEIAQDLDAGDQAAAAASMGSCATCSRPAIEPEADMDVVAPRLDVDVGRVSCDGVGQQAGDTAGNGGIAILIEDLHQDLVLDRRIGLIEAELDIVAAR